MSIRRAAFTACLTAGAVAGTCGESSAQDALSPFARAKAEALLVNRLSCLGCHTLDGDGGLIGPDLSRVGLRHPPERLAQIIRDPETVFPGTVMPRVRMPETWETVIVAYLAGRTRGAEKPDAPAPTEPSSARRQPLPEIEGEALYNRSCASCHGPLGRGDGFNAASLPVAPTAHADEELMAARTDDALFDAIHAGGYVMNRSHRMPPFGEALSRDQIWSLVRYIRTLCGCQGPAWSRDGIPR